MTYRERREARAERLRDWAAKRDVKADAAYEAARRTADMIPFGQPILAGHHSQKRHTNDLARIDRNMGRSVENAQKAESMRSRAANIEAAADRAIYSDDENAVEALKARIAGLEAERDQVKAYNASCRAGTPDESLLDERQRSGLESARKYAPYQVGKLGEMPKYHLANLSGNIGKQRKRLALLEGKNDA